jgi:hypothetical protein
LNLEVAENVSMHFLMWPICPPWWQLIDTGTDTGICFDLVNRQHQCMCLVFHR